MINPSHARSLVRAGIGKIYHEMSWKEVTKCPDLSHPDYSEIREGIGISFVGVPSNNLNTLFYLYARDMHLSGVGCRVVRLATLIRSVGKQAEIVSDWMEIPALFIDGFFLDNPYKEGPFRPYEMLAGEELIRDRISCGRPVFVKANQGILECASWWTPDILQLIAKKTVTIKVLP